MNPKRLGMLVVAAVLIGIVVASVILIVARGRLWSWSYPTTQISTTTTVTTSVNYVSLQGPKGFIEELLKRECGKSTNLIVLLYLKTKPNASFVNMVKDLFGEVLSKYARLSGSTSVCLVNVSATPRLAKEVKSKAYPVVALALRGSIAEDLYKLFNDVDGLLIAKEALSSYLLSRLTQYIAYEQIHVETNVEPRIDNATPILGSRNAPVYLFIYEDTHCPFCALFYHESMNALLKLVKEGKLTIVFKNLIVHPESRLQHVYIEAAYLATRNATMVLEVMKNIYEKLYDLCFVKKKCYENIVDKTISDASVISLIEKYGKIRISALNKYLNASSKVVDEDSAEALSYGISGTPGFLIWNRVKHYGLVVVGVHSAKEMEKLIERVLSN